MPKQKEIFTDEEIQKCWDNININNMDTVIFLLYTGFRISEMLELKIENIDLQNQTIMGGTKTAAGKNRIVPIHSKIKEIVENRYKMSRSGYLFEQNGKEILIHIYRIIWANLMKIICAKHNPHECRHTFRSKLDSAGANKVCIDLMMGHKNNDVGERVYTHKTIDELRQSVELIN